MAVLNEIDSGQSCRAIANELGVEKTHIQGIVRDKKDILKRREASERERFDSKYTKVRKWLKKMAFMINFLVKFRCNAHSQ